MEGRKFQIGDIFIPCVLVISSQKANDLCIAFFKVHYFFSLFSCWKYSLNFFNSYFAFLALIKVTSSKQKSIADFLNSFSLGSKDFTSPSSLGSSSKFFRDFQVLSIAFSSLCCYCSFLPEFVIEVLFCQLHFMEKEKRNSPTGSEPFEREDIDQKLMKIMTSSHFDISKRLI